MPSRNQIISQIRQIMSERPDTEVGIYIDNLRKDYIKQLSNCSGRNTIAYYSAFMTKQSLNMDINDSDINGFMCVVHDLDRSKGLDLILHTPGGSPTASESIVKYLRKMFKNDIRVIVPHMAMSAGTMIACSSKEIVMGTHSSLGPIDPQFNGIPAYNIKSEFEEAEIDLEKNPNKAAYWAIKLQQYPAAFMKSAIDAIDLSNKLLTDWLGTSMFDKENDEEQIDNIVKKLNNHTDSLVHDRHFDIDTCKKIGLKIVGLEEDQEFQEKVLSIHHAMMISFENFLAVKMIESCENTYIINSNNN